MKKKLMMLLLVLVLFVSVPVTALAGSGDSGARLDYVTDLYGLLSDSQREELEKQAAAVSEAYGCSIYVLVVNNYRDYASDTFQFAMDVYNDYNLGWGSDKNGVLLMLSMAERDYELVFQPDPENDPNPAFTEYGKDLLEDRFLSYFRNNDFFGGFREYIYACGEYLQAAKDGKPIDREKHFSVLYLLPGALVAAITGGALSAPMNSAGKKHNANQYFAANAVELRERTDVFTHRSVVRRPKETSNRSSGGGGGGSHHSGSFSGRSGKF